jgi:hypothetical protein
MVYQQANSSENFTDYGPAHFRVHDEHPANHFVDQYFER